MARIEIPALYRLDVGSSKWGWYKMVDLISAVNHILARSPLDQIGSSEKDAFVRTKEKYMYEIMSREMFKRFGRLNKDDIFVLSNGYDLFELTHRDAREAVFDQNLYVPAQWGMSVIRKVKRMVAKEEESPGKKPPSAKKSNFKQPQITLRFVFYHYSTPPPKALYYIHGRLSDKICHFGHDEAQYARCALDRRQPE